MLASKVVVKGMSKQKNEGKDDHPNKKGPGNLFVDKQPKQLLPPKPSHGTGKGLMTVEGPVAQGVVCLRTRIMPSRWLNQSSNRQI